MPKRLTDTEKWADDFFMNLSPAHKLFFFYLLDNCDHAGFWKVNKRLAEFQIGETLDIDAALADFGDRVRVVGDKWFITKFIDFQYKGHLNPSDQVHKSVIKLLESNGIDLSPYQGPDQTLTRPSAGSMVMVKDKVKANDLWEKFWSVCTNKQGKIPARASWDKLTQEEQETAIRAWPAYASHCAKTKFSMKHPQGWLNDKRFNDQFESGPRSAKREYKSMDDLLRG